MGIARVKELIQSTLHPKTEKGDALSTVEKIKLIKDELTALEEALKQAQAKADQVEEVKKLELQKRKKEANLKKLEEQHKKDEEFTRRALAQSPGIKPALKRKQQPGTMMADSYDMGALLDKYVVMLEVDQKDEYGNIKKSSITQSGSYILSAVDLEETRFQGGKDAGKTQLQQLAEKFRKSIVRHSNAEYQLARAIDYFEELLKRIATIAHGHKDKSLNLLIPTQHHGNHWCLTQVAVHNGQVTHIDVWEPMFGKGISASGFQRFQTIYRQKLREKRDLESRAQRIEQRIAAHVRSGNSKFLARLLEEQAIVKNELDVITQILPIFEKTTFTHTLGKRQVDGYSCGDQVVCELLNRAFPKGTAEDTVSTNAPSLANIRDIDETHPGVNLDVRGQLLRQAFAEALIKSDSSLRKIWGVPAEEASKPVVTVAVPAKAAKPAETKAAEPAAPSAPAVKVEAPVKEAKPTATRKKIGKKKTSHESAADKAQNPQLTERKILAKVFAGAVERMKTVSNPETTTDEVKQTMLDAEWDNVVDTVRKRENKEVQIDFDARLARKINELDYKYQGRITDDNKLVSLARQELLVERAKEHQKHHRTLRNAKFITLFAPKADATLTAVAEKENKAKPTLKG